MSARLPPILPALETPPQRKTHEVVDSLKSVLGESFASTNSEGAVVGPYASLLYAPPAIVEPFLSLVIAIIKNPELAVRERELSILAVTSVYHPAFMTYAHTGIGAAVGLSSDQVADARSGEIPKGLSQEEEVVYEFSRELAGARGPVGKGLWDRAKARLGTAKLVVLIHVVGGYAYTAMIMNAADVQVPKEGE